MHSADIRTDNRNAHRVRAASKAAAALAGAEAGADERLEEVNTHDQDNCVDGGDRIDGDRGADGPAPHVCVA
jgi:hypothetical protein